MHKVVTISVLLLSLAGSNSIKFQQNFLPILITMRIKDILVGNLKKSQVQNLMSLHFWLKDWKK